MGGGCDVLLRIPETISVIVICTFHDIFKSLGILQIVVNLRGIAREISKGTLFKVLKLPELSEIVSLNNHSLNSKPYVPSLIMLCFSQISVEM